MFGRQTPEQLVPRQNCPSSDVYSGNESRALNLGEPCVAVRHHRLMRCRGLGALEVTPSGKPICRTCLAAFFPFLVPSACDGDQFSGATCWTTIKASPAPRMTLASAPDRSPTGCTSWRDTYRIQNSNPLAFASSQMRRLSTELASNPCTPGGAATTLPGSGIWRLPRTSSARLDAFGGQGWTRRDRRDDRLSDRTQDPRYLAPCPKESRALRLITAETRMISGGSAYLQGHHSPELPVRRIQADHIIWPTICNLKGCSTFRPNPQL